MARLPIGFSYLSCYSYYPNATLPEDWAMPKTVQEALFALAGRTFIPEETIKLKTVEPKSVTSPQQEWAQGWQPPHGN